MLARVKKVVLSGSVVVLFGLYALQRQTQQPNLVPAVAQRPPAVTSTSTELATVLPVVATTTKKPSSATKPSAPTQTALVTIGVLGRTTRTPTIFVRPTRTVMVEPTEKPTIELASSGALLDGTYTGDSADARWGNVIVQAVITNGQLSDVQFEEFPNHRNRSKEINQRAMPILIQEAIQSQSAEVDLVSGATDTSEAFIESLDSALRQAAK
jgi:uncharacterized protein with FMN-binding domain